MTTKQAARIVAYVIQQPLNCAGQWSIYQELKYDTAYGLLPSYLRWNHKNKYYSEYHDQYTEAQHILEVMEAI